MKKLLVLSSLYPNSAQPHRGIFTEHRVRSLLKTKRVDVRVIAPIPWVPIKSVGERISKYSSFASAPKSETRWGIPIIYPRYPVIPKVGMTLAPFLMAAALIRPIKALMQDGYDFDLIDAYYFYPDGIAAAILSRYFNKPIIITAFGTDINLIPKYLLPRRMIQWAAKQANGMTSVCQALKDRIVELDIPESSVRVVLHGVDRELFKPHPDRDALRAQLGFSSRRTLLSVGYLVERKGHHVVIQALKNLPDVDLIIAGDGEEEQSLKALAKSIGVSQRVRFLGRVDQTDLCAYYGAADALVLASDREGIANVLLESMACGTPVLVTKVWGAPEVINAPEAGVLIENRTPESLVHAANLLFANYPAHVATRQFTAQFSWEQTSEQHLALVDGILDREA